MSNAESLVSLVVFVVGLFITAALAILGFLLKNKLEEFSESLKSIMAQLTRINDALSRQEEINKKIDKSAEDIDVLKDKFEELEDEVNEIKTLQSLCPNCPRKSKD